MPSSATESAPPEHATHSRSGASASRSRATTLRTIPSARAMSGCRGGSQVLGGRDEMTHDSTIPLRLMTDAPERSPSQRELQVQQLLDDPLRIEDLDDASALVPELPAQGFVRVARRLQQEHRLELVLAHATPDQITSLL